MKKSKQNDEKCTPSEVQVPNENYPPDLTVEIKESLEQEIAAFDQESVLKEIEQNAVGGNDVPGYAKWRDQQGSDHLDHGHRYGSVPFEAEPDLLSEEEAVNLMKPVLSGEIVKAKEEIDEILSPRELRIWNMVMRNGTTYKKAADLLHLSELTVKTYLQRAKIKVKRHFLKESHDAD